MGLIAQERLEANSMGIPFSGCRVWLGATNGPGKYGRGEYGVITFNGKHLYVHRLAYEVANGPIPKGMLVCHRCDVRTCINPDHLFLGDPMTNHLDKVEKGRARSPGAPGDKNYTRKHPEIVRGERNPNSKLSADDVRIIREALASGVEQRPLAIAFGVGQSQISRINRGAHWK